MLKFDVPFAFTLARKLRLPEPLAELVLGTSKLDVPVPDALVRIL